MTQEEKDLLFKDLCARLPYELYFKLEVDGKSTNKILTPEWINDIKYHPQHFKPYLRPMSSMTEEEHNIVHDLLDCFNPKNELWMLTDFLSKRMLDYRGLIEKGLALEAPEGLYNFDGIIVNN